MFINKNQLLMLTIAIIIIYFFYIINKTINIDNNATAGQYSQNNNYANITPMKHDIFKQLTIDIFGIILLGLVTQKEFINFDDLLNSIVGRSLLTGLGFGFYYQIVQPYLINRLPNF